MKKIRIGKDIIVKWNILTNGEPISLEGRDLYLELIDPLKFCKKIDFNVNVNEISFILSGTEQKRTGTYSLTLWENYGIQGQTAVDCCEAFALVDKTCNEEGFDKCLKTETVQLDTANIDVFKNGIAGVPDAPTDGNTYGLKNGEWAQVISCQDISLALVLSQEEYDKLETINENTLYIIV